MVFGRLNGYCGLKTNGVAMGRFFGIVVVLLLAAFAGYASFALSRDNSSSAMVKLIGPGRDLTTCVSRLRPHFERMEPAMTEIAKALLDSKNIVGVEYAYYRPDNKKLSIESEEGFRVPTEQEMEKFKPMFGRLEKPNYFSSGRFDKEDGKIFALSHVECGVSAFDWIRLRLGIDYRRTKKPVVTLSNYVYWVDDMAELTSCVDPLPEPDPPFVCEVPLNEHWSWTTLWAPTLDAPA